MSHLGKGLIAALVLPLAAVSAQAQHHGGGGGFHGGGGYHGGGVYHGGYSYGPRNFYGVNVSPYGVGFNYGYRGSNFGLGVSLGSPYYGYGGYGYRPYYGYGGYGGYYYGGYPWGLSSWSFATPYAYPIAYSAPATAAVVGAAIPVVPANSPPPEQPTQPAADPNVAYVEVRVPADAQVWLGPTPSDQTGPVRTFVSPPLETGFDYSYVVRARWVQNGVPVTRERKVPVHPGDRLSIDLTRPQ